MNLKQQKNFYHWHILISLIFNVIYYYKWAQILVFNTKLCQTPRTSLRPFSWTFGLAYSSLNSAKLSCSSEVTLILSRHIWLSNKFPAKEKRGFFPFFWAIINYFFAFFQMNSVPHPKICQSFYQQFIQIQCCPTIQKISTTKIMCMKNMKMRKTK